MHFETRDCKHDVKASKTESFRLSIVDAFLLLRNCFSCSSQVFWWLATGWNSCFLRAFANFIVTVDACVVASFLLLVHLALKWLCLLVGASAAHQKFGCAKERIIWIWLFKKYCNFLNKHWYYLINSHLRIKNISNLRYTSLQCFLYLHYTNRVLDFLKSNHDEINALSSS